jgi:hypothetical protein
MRGVFDRGPNKRTLRSVRNKLPDVVDETLIAETICDKSLERETIR